MPGGTKDLNGTYLTNYQRSLSSTAAYSLNGVGNQASGDGIARFNYANTFCATVGENIRGQIKWNHV